MNFLDLANLGIPGYSSLSEAQQAVFAKTRLGGEFVRFINQKLSAMQKFEETLWIRKDQQMEAYQSRLYSDIRDRVNGMKGQDSYQALLLQINIEVLNNAFDWFQFLSSEQQNTIAATPFSEECCAIITSADQSMQNKKSPDYQFHEGQRQGALKKWYANFETLENIEVLQDTIQTNKLIALKDRALYLSEFFPLLQHRKSPEEEPVITQLLSKYTLDDLEAAATVEEQYLTDIILHCLNQVTAEEISFFNCSTFNKEQANLMARRILEAYETGSDIDIALNELLSAYKRGLQAQLEDLSWELAPQPALGGVLDNALSYLMEQATSNERFQRLANAHAFIQATGFSTQNENSYFAMIFDSYNYAAHVDEINQAKNVISSLLEPLAPLIQEYKDIAKYEHNIYKKTFRSIMPLVVLVGTIVLASVLLAPLALPEIAFIAVLIPTILIGLALATKYISLKNNLFQQWKIWKHGSPFEIPEFQVNARMEAAFENHDKAQLVRGFYIEKLKHCDALEMEYAKKDKQGLLTDSELTERKKNIKLRHALCLEWYDIHSNPNVGYDLGRQIALKRIHTSGDVLFEQFKQQINLDKESVSQSIDQVVQDIKNTLTQTPANLLLLIFF